MTPKSEPGEQIRLPHALSVAIAEFVCPEHSLAQTITYLVTELTPAGEGLCLLNNPGFVEHGLSNEVYWKL